MHTVATREVKLVRESVPTIEGAGVRLRRAFGHGDETLFDPFLMIDDFRGERPAHYELGFPWHPHRGIETITYMLEGECDHGDSMGNKGTICAGDVQWMTAGGGIIHQEMPRGTESGRMGGFQLWANLPAAQKMRDPRYQGIESAEIPEVREDGALVRVIAGRVGDVGPWRTSRSTPSTSTSAGGVLSWSTLPRTTPSSPTCSRVRAASAPQRSAWTPDTACSCCSVTATR